MPNVFLSSVAGGAAQFFDSNGNPLNGGKIYTYIAGTTTPRVTYTDDTGLQSRGNPIVLDSTGRVPGSGEIWLESGYRYKFELKTSAEVLIATYDDIPGVNDLTIGTLVNPVKASEYYVGLNASPIISSISDISARNIASTRGNGTDEAYEARVTGDAAERFQVRADGRINWGDGTNAVDTNLYRSAANTLKTDDNLVVDGTAGITAKNTAKAWGRVTSAGAFSHSFGCASVTKPATGVYEITLSSALSDNNFPIIAMSEQLTPIYVALIAARTSSTVFRIAIRDLTAVPQDGAFSFVVFGNP